jgi:hypothetical protein
MRTRMASLRPTYAPTLYAALLLATTAAFVLWSHRAPARTAASHPALPAATIAHATRDDLTLRDRAIAVPDHIINERGCLGEARRWAFPVSPREDVTAPRTSPPRGAPPRCHGARRHGSYSALFAARATAASSAGRRARALSARRH